MARDGETEAPSLLQELTRTVPTDWHLPWARTPLGAAVVASHCHGNKLSPIWQLKKTQL